MNEKLSMKKKVKNKNKSKKKNNPKKSLHPSKPKTAFTTEKQQQNLKFLQAYFNQLANHSKYGNPLHHSSTQSTSIRWASCHLRYLKTKKVSLSFAKQELE